VIRGRFIAITVLLLAVSSVVSPERAQYSPTSPDTLPNNYPPPLPERRGPSPKLTFTIVGEIAVTGPLGDGSAWTQGGDVYVPSASGVWRIPPVIGATPEALAPVPPPGDADGGWRMAANGLRRYRSTLEGIVEAQKRRSVRSHWRRDWRIVAPNATPAPPLLIGPRLCYAGLDDRVTCVRASNGHRLWAVDLGDRISRPIAAWPVHPPREKPAKRGDRSLEGEVLLVVPDNGASIVALDAYDGTKIAAYELPAAKNRFASAPFVFASERIAVVRKGYATDEAALTLLDLVAAPPPTSAEPAGGVPYNAGSPSTPKPPGR
jgi:hypothetical protein